MTPVQVQRLAAYRSRHVIAWVKDWSDEPREGFVMRCAHCHLRVIQRRSGQRPLLWRHHPDDVRALAKAERGE
jgi:hypothetical protein